MADPRGFLNIPRELPKRRPVDVRISDWHEVYEPFATDRLQRQAARCMDCGIPFCHQGCPLGNLIPEWNDLVWREDWREASERLHATNNFPEFTGLLRYGIPEFKLEKRHLDRRLVQMLAEGTVFRCGVNVGVDVTVEQLRDQFDAVVLAGGACVARGLPVPGAQLSGVHQAMEFLPLANRAVADSLADGRAPREPAISARGRNVVIIGGGDTGADCLGTVLRQGAASVAQLEIMPRPPEHRPEGQPWPTYPMVYRVSSAHEEGGERVYAVSTQEFLGDSSGRVRALRLVEVGSPASGFAPVPGTERELPCELVLLAMGFTGAERDGLLTSLGVEFDQRGNVARDGSYATSVPGVFVAGDMGRGQSLIVWAIAEGRSAAAAVDRYLAGDTLLPAAIPPTARPHT